MSLVVYKSLPKSITASSRNLPHNFLAGAGKPNNIETQEGVLIPVRRLIAPEYFQIVPGIQPAGNQFVNYEEIEFLVERLKEITCGKLELGIGFRPLAKSKEDLNFGHRAKDLANKLMDYPSQDNLEAARRFLRADKLISTLEKIAKRRNLGNFGFGKMHDNDPDLKLAGKASELALRLKKQDSVQNIKDAMYFIELVKLIKEVEKISKEKNKGNFGLKQEPVLKQDKEIAKAADEIAEALKTSPSHHIVKVALDFLAIIKPPL